MRGSETLLDNILEAVRNPRDRNHILEATGGTEAVRDVSKRFITDLNVVRGNAKRLNETHEVLKGRSLGVDLGEALDKFEEQYNSPRDLVYPFLQTALGAMDRVGLGLALVNRAVGNNFLGLGKPGNIYGSLCDLVVGISHAAEERFTPVAMRYGGLAPLLYGSEEEWRRAMLTALRPYALAMAMSAQAIGIEKEADRLDDRAIGLLGRSKHHGQQIDSDKGANALSESRQVGAQLERLKVDRAQKAGNNLGNLAQGVEKMQPDEFRGALGEAKEAGTESSEIAGLLDKQKKIQREVMFQLALAQAVYLEQITSISVSDAANTARQLAYMGEFVATLGFTHTLQRSINLARLNLWAAGEYCLKGRIDPQEIESIAQGILSNRMLPTRSQVDSR